MFSLSRPEFEELVERAVQAVPATYKAHLKNVAFLVEDEPSPEQRVKLKLNPYQSLFGLYEGLPLAKRQGQTKLLPDKITLFQKPLEASVSSKDDLQKQIYHTVWHEVAHYYGLDHERIRELEQPL